MNRCQYFTDDVAAGVTLDIRCKSRGRFVYVRLRKREYLTLCEVEVYAEEGGGIF